MDLVDDHALVWRLVNALHVEEIISDPFRDILVCRESIRDQNRERRDETFHSRDDHIQQDIRGTVLDDVDGQHLTFRGSDRDDVPDLLIDRDEGLVGEQRTCFHRL